MPPQPAPPSAYRVLVNDHQQFLIWPAARVLPCGWRPTSVAGSQTDCLAYVDRAWTSRPTPGETP
jgi:MbtH protein